VRWPGSDGKGKCSAIVLAIAIAIERTEKQWELTKDENDKWLHPGVGTAPLATPTGIHLLKLAPLDPPAPSLAVFSMHVLAPRQCEVAVKEEDTKENRIPTTQGASAIFLAETPAADFVLREERQAMSSMHDC
jgi:hypothetical protein